MEKEPQQNHEHLKSLEDGEATMEARCPVCNWTSEKIFTIGDEERDMVCIRLEESHESTGCKTVLNFEEKHPRSQ
jgi:hypothetical protein